MCFTGPLCRLFQIAIWLLVLAYGNNAWSLDSTLTKTASADSTPASGDTVLPPENPSANADSTPEQSIAELDRMIVRDRRFAGRDETSNAAVVSGEDIKETFRATPLEELAQQSADVYVTSRGSGLHGVASGASGGIYVRGLGGSPNSQILVVEDDVPDYQGIFGHPIPDAFVPALMERVVLVKGGDGVLYGTNAMGGAIVIENRWPVEKNTRLSTETAYGSYNTFRQRACLEKNSGRIAAIAAGNAFTTNGHRAGMDGKSASLQFGLRRNLNDNWSFSIREKGIYLNGNDPGAKTAPHLDNRFDVWRNSTVLRVDGTIGDAAVASNVWVNAGVHKLYNGFYSRDYTGGCKLEMTAGIREMLDVIAGLQGDYIDGVVRNRIENTPEHVEPVMDGAAYGQATFLPRGRFQAVIGGRALYSDPYGFVPLYKCGMRLELLDTLTLHTRVTRNFRQPTLRELYLPFPTANPDLLPEHALNWDGGAELRWRKLVVSGTVFRTWATNLIKYFGSPPSVTTDNIDEIKIWGVDTKFALLDAGPVSVEIAYCWQDVGRFTKQNPEAKANANLHLRHEIGASEAELKIGAEWVHGLFMNNYGRDPLDDVFFVDMRLRLLGTLPGGVSVAPFAVIRNLLDREYEYIEGYPMPRINVLCGLSLEI